MDREANLLGPLSPSSSTKSNLVRPINPDSNLSRSFTSTSSSSSSLPSSSTSGFVRNVQAAFKRHRPLNTMQSNNLRPRRLLVPQRETSKITTSNPGPPLDLTKTQDEVFGSQGLRVRDYNSQAVNTVPVVNENQVDSSITPPSMTGTVTNTYEESIKPFDVKRDQRRSFVDYKSNDIDASSLVEPQHVPLVDSQKKIQFSLANNGRPCEMECDVSNQLEAVANISNGLEHQNFHNVEVDISLRSGGANSSLFAKKTMELQDRLHQFRSFLHGDLSHHMTQSSVVGSSCATTTLVNSASAPMPNSMTHCSHPHQNSSSNMAIESLGECNVNFQPMTEGNMVQPSCPSSKCTNRMSADQTAIETQAPCTTVDTRVEVKDDLVKELQGNGPKEGDFRKDPSPLDDNSNKAKGLASDVLVLKSQSSLSKNLSSEVKVEPSKLEKQEKAANGKAAPRKKSYDPDLFFKVNGKLYQRLGKIGSGGSSEVHKVISSDCTIYALKKIKLKGMIMPLHLGFVTDKALLQEVMNGSIINKDAKVKEDGYIYMVLEYGEIDLAHMLSQKWKEMDSTNSTIDENWLRFYWQQILLAVKIIHEERIVHSDLKPANFLLVRGSLKLIDFGIAKAILNDTTNIQRDSQVGTLSYMSPEAFMCNETDADGNTIKCGRPSDIWSLGCILYQMVYGRTPFSEFKTFWAKFKVITDPNRKITYEPVSNPWLLDLMRKCLAWERNERWRIPQLLQHPFLVPPIPSQLSSSHQDQSCKLLQSIAESCENNQKALMLCSELQELLRDPRPAMVSQEVNVLLDPFVTT
ncbi:Serine/threonine-protein kinase MPS1 [Camellia lanceoleosa]|uniref:Serine/threonine-protein kinase MPS1 n=1 Tax=Camellia lanceoleosa TaxID=1840588 RepID=A0ACC0HUX6_9ERIC|nr:Serine/threonine-protein kinase MPS1 [Camellia lanceoleosa]